MEYTYKTRGVCPSELSFELDGDKVTNVSFKGGCNGNLKAISKLVDGMNARDVIEMLHGNTCGFKKTSCADQLTIALREALDNKND